MVPTSRQQQTHAVVSALSGETASARSRLGLHTLSADLARRHIRALNEGRLRLALRRLFLQDVITSKVHLSVRSLLFRLLTCVWIVSMQEDRHFCLLFEFHAPIALGLAALRRIELGRAESVIVTNRGQRTPPNCQRLTGKNACPPARFVSPTAARRARCLPDRGRAGDRSQG